MPAHNKVAWTEGMFIRPHHFQQQDRYVEYVARARFEALQSYGFGFLRCKIENSLLAIGKVGLEYCQGIFSEGTVFDCPAEHALPAPLTIPSACTNEIVYLGLPLRQSGIPEITSLQNEHPLARYAIQESAVYDESAMLQDSASIAVAELRPRLMIGKENAAQFTLIPVARVIEKLSDGKVILDEHFIPPCLSCHAFPRLSNFISEAAALLEQRSQSLSNRIGDINRSAGVNAIADFLLLQLAHRYLPVLHHFSNKSLVHPEQFYLVLIELLGSLQTFQKNRHETGYPIPVYQHEALHETFNALIQALRECLLNVVEPMAQAIPLHVEDYGITVGVVHDLSLFERSEIILAVNANEIPTETLISRFSTQIKVGPTDHIHQLVNLQLPGMGLRLLPVAPVQMPFNAQLTYFQLLPEGPLWEEVQATGGIAIHTSGELSRLKFELWIIRG